jgi:hypothetical protein
MAKTRRMQHKQHKQRKQHRQYNRRTLKRGAGWGCIGTSCSTGVAEMPGIVPPVVTNTTNKTSVPTPSQTDQQDLSNKYQSFFAAYNDLRTYVENFDAETVQYLPQPFEQMDALYKSFYTAGRQFISSISRVRSDLYEPMADAVLGLRMTFQEIIAAHKKTLNAFLKEFEKINSGAKIAELNQRLAVIKGTFRASVPTLAQLQTRLDALKQKGGKKLTRKRAGRRSV